MSCNRFSVSRKDPIIQDSPWTALALEIFLRAHCMLRNFFDILKLRAPECCDADDDKAPLHGALDVVGTAMKSIVCGNGSGKELQGSGLFREVFLCSRCQDNQDLPENIIYKVETILSCLERSCSIENITYQIKDVLLYLDQFSSDTKSENFRMLSFLLKEIIKKIICDSEIYRESLNSTQTNLLGDLVNKFIRDWSEKGSRPRPCIRICRFCEDVIDKVARQWGTFCCKNAGCLNDIWKEWSMQEAISDSTKYTKKEQTPGIIEDITGIQDSDKLSCYKCFDIDAKSSRIDDSCRKQVADPLGKYSIRTNKFDRCKCIASEDRKDRKLHGKYEKIGEKDLRKVHGDTRDGTPESGKRQSKDKAKKDKLPGSLAKSPDGGGKTKRSDRNGGADPSKRKPSGGRSRTERGNQAKKGEGKRKDLRGSRKKKAGLPGSDGGKRKQGGTDDSDLMKKRKAGKGKDRKAASVEDKSTLDSEERKKMKARVSHKKGSGILDSSRSIVDDYSKINGSRSHRRKSTASKLHDGENGTRTNTIKYQLSDLRFVKLGWTVLPVIKTMRKIVLHQSRAAKPHLDWFKNTKYKERIYYDDKPIPFLDILPDGSARVFYPNGRIAIKAYKPKLRKCNVHIVFSAGGGDALGVERDIQIIAIFDSDGNCAVFDKDGGTRLSYNQIGGICTDDSVGPPFSWTWNSIAHQSIPKTVYVEKSTAHLERLLDFGTMAQEPRSFGSSSVSVTPSSSMSQEKIALQGSIFLDSNKVEIGSEFLRDSDEIFCCKTICMKLNDYISLRILGRKNINLQFLADRKFLRIELGTILNLDREVASYFVDASFNKSAVRSKYENILNASLKPGSSLYDLMKEFRKIKKAARRRNISKHHSFANHRKKSEKLFLEN